MEKGLCDDGEAAWGSDRKNKYPSKAVRKKSLLKLVFAIVLYDN